MTISRLALGAFAAAVLLGSSALPSRASADPRVQRILAQSGQAVGVASLRGVRTIRVDSSVLALQLHGTNVQYSDLADGRLSERTDLMPYVQIDGYDGRVAWNADASGLVWNDGSDSGRSAEIDQAYIASYSLWKPQAAGAGVTWLGTKQDKGQSYDALAIGPAGSKLPFEMWFSRATHLPARAIIPGGYVTSVITFSDYRSTHGVSIAHAVHLESTDGNSSDSKVERVTLDSSEAPAQLRRPTTHPTDFSILNGATSTTIPVALHENHVYLNVMVNGKGPFNFIFDTGGSNVIDPAVAKEIAVTSSGSAQGSGAGAQTESLSIARVSTLQVGDAVVNDQLFAVAPTRQGFGISAGRPVDGLIGWEVLARFVTTFDYANQRVVLTLPAAAQSQPTAHVIPFVLYGTQPQIGCTIDGLPAECTIDTGARDTLGFMTPYIAAHPQIVPATVTAVGVNGFGFGGPSLGKLGRVQDVGIADFHFHNLVADYSVQPEGALTTKFIAANLGGNLLRRFTVTFDYYRETMALVPSPAYDEPETYERSGLFLINHDGKITVLDARPGTPAANAGIVKGDVIDAVDGVDVSTMSLAQIRDTFSKPASTVVRLELIGKDGTKRMVTLTLRDYV